MYHHILSLILVIFYYSGLVKLARWWQCLSSHSLTILCYHSAAGEHLRSQWLYLRRHYRICPLDSALAELREPSIGKRDRRPLLAITFDDGYQDNYTQAFALATELHIPFTIFLISEYTECGNAFWWADRLIRLAQTSQVSLDGQTYSLDHLEERKALAEVIADRMTTLTSSVDQDQFIASLCEALHVPVAALPEEAPIPLLTWAQVQEMQESGLVSFGAHTRHHPDLAQLVSPIEAQSEVGACRAILEQQLRHPMEIFAYPYGHVGDYGLSAAKQAGYTWAVTTTHGVNTSKSNSHLLHRKAVNANMSIYELASLAAGALDFFLACKKVIRRFYR